MIIDVDNVRSSRLYMIVDVDNVRSSRLYMIVDVDNVWSSRLYMIVDVDNVWSSRLYMIVDVDNVQYAQFDLARNHSGPTSEKLKKKSVLTPRNVREKSNTVIYF
jgi:hypothetical protein